MQFQKTPISDSKLAFFFAPENIFFLPVFKGLASNLGLPLLAKKCKIV